MSCRRAYVRTTAVTCRSVLVGGAGQGRARCHRRRRCLAGSCWPPTYECAKHMLLYSVQLRTLYEGSGSTIVPSLVLLQYAERGRYIHGRISCGQRLVEAASLVICCATLAAVSR